ncbi:endo-1,4-beta-xylanase [Streptomyces sp. FXJ1.172]|nr:endo-1,4-beta-xylanase [Streptomyces sp. FXJ1.172]WEO93254.1 endo-1,4-beta-xylanase [Streptomyces sp. FXJ1.172]
MGLQRQCQPAVDRSAGLLSLVNRLHKSLCRDRRLPPHEEIDPSCPGSTKGPVWAKSWPRSPESHFGTGGPPAGFQTTLSNFASLGVDVQITELDIAQASPTQVWDSSGGANQHWTLR